MKLTATTTSTSLYDLIDATAGAIAKIEKKKVGNELNGVYGVEIKRKEADIYVETILDTASTDSRPVDEATPIFAFNCQSLQNVYVYGEGDFYISVV